MHRQLTILNYIQPIAVLFIVMLTISGCSSSSSDLATEVSGKWKLEQGTGTVDINLAKDASSVTIDGRTFKGVVDKVDKGSNTVHVKMETESGNTEEWTIHQVWNDNGSTFKLNLRRNGTSETLVPIEQS